MDNIRLETRVLQVPSRNQISENTLVFGPPDGTPRIMFLGNSITWHSERPEIGWYGNWGMAASSRDTDYVHLVMAALLKQYPAAAFCIAQGADWEVENGNCDLEAMFAAAKEFEPDIILSTLEANIPEAVFDGETFIRETERLHQYLSRPDGKTRRIIATSICRSQAKDRAITQYAEQTAARCVMIGDIFEDQTNLAIGLFEHEGVAHHPSDKGMKNLAQRYLNAIEQTLAEMEGQHELSHL